MTNQHPQSEEPDHAAAARVYAFLRHTHDMVPLEHRGSVFNVATAAGKAFGLAQVDYRTMTRQHQSTTQYDPRRCQINYLLLHEDHRDHGACEGGFFA